MSGDFTTHYSAPQEDCTIPGAMLPRSQAYDAPISELPRKPMPYPRLPYVKQWRRKRPSKMRDCHPKNSFWSFGGFAVFIPKFSNLLKQGSRLPKGSSGHGIFHVRSEGATMLMAAQVEAS